MVTGRSRLRRMALIYLGDQVRRQEDIAWCRSRMLILTEDLALVLNLRSPYSKDVSL